MVLDWLTGGRKTDHPMHSVEAAKALLADLPRDPLQALQEVTSWFGTYKAADGIRPPMRIAVSRLIGEAGQPLELRLLEDLTSTHIKEFRRIQLWKAALAFRRAEAETYTSCIDLVQADSKRAGLTSQDVALLYVRALRAFAEQDKLLHLRYEPLSEE